MANIHDVNESLQVQPSVRNLPTLIALSQGENGRSLQFRMVGATIPSGSSASLSGTKPDGVVYSKAGTVDGNTVIFQEDVQLTAVAGAWDAKIHIVNSGNSVATALIRFIIDPDPVAAGAVPSDTQLEGIVAECKLYAEAARSNAYGSPLTASAAADMIDTSKVYVYTGDETGYTAGHWYYYNGTAWADGGVYNSIAIQTDTTLTLPDHAADAKATGDALATKAEKIGDITLAERLYGGEYTSESEPYHFRQAPDGMGSKSETIVGGSLGWNQLLKTVSTSTVNGITFTNNGDGSYTLNGTATATAIVYLNIDQPILQGHKYLLIGCASGGSSNTYQLSFRVNNASVIIVNDNGNGAIGVPNETYANGNVLMRVCSGETVTNVKLVPQLIDLTACFGTTIADYIYTLETATAGAGVAWVKRYIDLDTYHEYDAGSIQSVEGLVSHDVVGFNQWDEEWELGSLNSQGQPSASSTSIRCKNFIRILPNTTYCYYNRTGSSLAPWYYDAEQNFIARSQAYIASNGTFTTPSNAYYMKIALPGTYGATYKHDVCINLSDPSRNGTYEPYEKHSYPLDSSLTLRGVPKLITDHLEFDGDKYRADGSVERRYGVVDLGTLNYGYNSESSQFYTMQAITDMKTGLATSEIPPFICVKYPSSGIGASRIPDKTIGTGTSGGKSSGVVIIGDSSCTDTASFKTAMSGVMLIYELATPTTETAQPFQSPMLVGQTEEYVSECVVPVGHESKYYEDVTKKVNGLPKDFSTLIAPVEVTFTATRNYSVGSYLIVKNQLYKVTSAISSGGTITPNSNVTATSIMAEILALA